jgi:glucose/arabinose dehydrogenase
MRVATLTATVSLLLVSCHSSMATSASPRPFKIASVARFDEPWAMKFLPDGRMLVTQKKGQLLLVDVATGKSVEVSGVPRVRYGDQGGFLDVALAPDFARSGLIYLTYAEPDPIEDKASSLALARGKLVTDGGAPRLEGMRVIWRQEPKGTGGQFGAIVTFSPDGRALFLTSGERQRKTPAQDPDQALGKILRLNLDGSVPADNPQYAKGGVRAITWTSGHRNPYGLTFAPDGRLWEIEMGPMGGDELNLIEPGRNYGWPIVSNGDNYDGSPIPDHPTRPEFAAPKLWWNPSISPSGLIIYSGAMFPQYKGSAFIGALSGEALVRVAIDGANAKKADQWDMGTRIRDVEQGPDGAIWLLEDGGEGSGGRLLKLTTAR